MIKKFTIPLRGEFIVSSCDGMCVLTCTHATVHGETRESVLEEHIRGFRGHCHRWLSDDTVVFYNVGDNNCKGFLADITHGRRLEDL